MEDMESGITVRYRQRERSLVLDVVPLEVRLAGLGGQWRKAAAEVLLVDGREELARELVALRDDARAYVRGKFSRVRALPTFEYAVEGALVAPDSRERARAVTIPRFARFASGG